MKKNKLRVIQISGIRGLLSAAFIVVCLAAGFIVFPALVLNKLWNHIADITGAIPYINMFQGLILWAILAVSYLIINKKQKYLVAFEPQTSKREIKDIINEIKSQTAELKHETPPLETQDIKIQPAAQKNSEQKEEEKSKEVV